MKAAKSICKRCHRLRPVNAARYCTPCDSDLRAEERRPHAAPPTEDPPVAEKQ